jgi:phosphopantothenoylcysteine decarboxylase
MRDILLGACGSIGIVKLPQIALSLHDLGYTLTIVLTKAAAFFFDFDHQGSCQAYDPVNYIKLIALVRNGTVVVVRADDEWDRLLDSASPAASSSSKKNKATLNQGLKQSTAASTTSDPLPFLCPVPHIELRDSHRMLLIAPLSANSLAKFSNGLCDDTLSNVVRAWEVKSKPAVVAPAMNTQMWTHPITQTQLSLLQSYWTAPYVLLNPVSKLLACNTVGVGALADVQTITDAVQDVLKPGRRSSLMSDAVHNLELESRKPPTPPKTVATHELSVKEALPDPSTSPPEPFTQEPSTQEPSTQEPSTQKPSAQELSTQEPSTPPQEPSTPPQEPSTPPAIPETVATRKQSMKEALLKLAKERFAEAASGTTSAQLAAPISPTNDAVIDAALGLDCIATVFQNSAPGGDGPRCFDLGAGDGRWLTAIAKKFGVKCVGVEIDDERLELAQVRIRDEGLQSLVELRKQSVFDDIDGLDKSSLIVMYLFREAMVKMAELMKRMQRKQAVVVVSVGFKLPGFACDTELFEKGIHCYVYKLDPNVN